MEVRWTWRLPPHRLDAFYATRPRPNATADYSCVENVPERFRYILAMDANGMAAEILAVGANLPPLRPDQRKTGCKSLPAYAGKRYLQGRLTLSLPSPNRRKLRTSCRR